MRDDVPGATDRIATQIVDAGFQAHQALGAGLLESAYEECLAYELTQRGISYQRQVGMPLSYKGLKLDVGYRIDLLAASSVVIEIKAIEALLPIHQAQVITYLKLSGCRIGLLMNFNTRLYKNGVRRIAL
jgi:GxxExxY protein